MDPRGSQVGSRLSLRRSWVSRVLKGISGIFQRVSGGLQRPRVVSEDLKGASKGFRDILGGIKGFQACLGSIREFQVVSGALEWVSGAFHGVSRAFQGN